MALSLCVVVSLSCRGFTSFTFDLGIVSSETSVMWMVHKFVWAIAIAQPLVGLL